MTDSTIGTQGEHDAVAVAREGLVHGVVDDLGDQVVQAALTGGADVHARTLADGLEALEHGDRRGVVVAVAVGRDRCRVGEDRGWDVGHLIDRGLDRPDVSGVGFLAHTHLFGSTLVHDCSHDSGRGW
jgi:hypothetical protein